MGCIESLPWDLGEWQWDPIASLGDALFYFGYVAKGRYITNTREGKAFEVIHDVHLCSKLGEDYPKQVLDRLLA